MSETNDFSQITTESRQAEPAAAGDPNDLTINAAVVSHMGCVRTNNEDNFFFDGDLMQDGVVDQGAAIRAVITKPFHLLAVCDGMGGLKGGERASSIGVHAMQTINRCFPASAVGMELERYAVETCERIYQDGVAQQEAGREGTTLALLYLVNDVAYAVNVGDSRVYLLRMGGLYQLTADHSPVYKMMMNGELTREQMRKHPRGNVIERFMGMEKTRVTRPYTAQFVCPLCADDRFLICSDGMSDLLTHAEIQQTLAENLEPMAAVKRLVARALEMGGKDNTTCIVADVSGASLPRATAGSLARLPLERK